MKLCAKLAVALGVLVLLPVAWAGAGEVYNTSGYYQVADGPEKDAAKDGAAGATAAQQPCGCGQEQCCFQQCCRCPRWTAQADMIVMERRGAPDVELMRLTRTREGLANAQGYDFGLKAGPRLSLSRHIDCGKDLELVYFAIDGWWDSQTRADSSGVRFDGPGFTVDAFNIPMQFNYTSKLYNAEANLWLARGERLRLMAGFRWLELRESLIGRNIGGWDPFWSNNTDNHIYGLQIGADARVWDKGGPFYITTVLKAGIYTNHAEQFGVSPVIGLPVNAEVNHGAFEGEVGVIGVYQYSCHLALRLGYQLMWLQGVALAPGQLHVSDTVAGVGTVDTNGAVFYHGALAGLELKF